MRKAYLIIFVLFFILSCASTEKTENGVEGEQEGETNYEKALDLLSRPHEDRFFTFINTTVFDTPGEKDTLLEQYGKNQEELVSFFFEAGNIFKALHYFKNLYAVKEVPGEERDAFYKKIDEKAGEQNYTCFRKYLKISGNPEIPGDEFSPILPITDYNYILTEIQVKREYLNQDGILRKDHPYLLGSGIVLDPHHILTAFHLVEDLFLKNTRSYEITVIQENNFYSNIKVLSWDSFLDIAVLETEEELNHFPGFYKFFGDSRNIRRGQSIYCLGHHSGYTSTLTKGIVSAEERDAPEGGAWIQVDASVSQGAGGGMLIGEDGLLYGMILGGIVHENINFAVPSNLILSVLDQLIRGMNIKRPWLGALLTTKNSLPGRVYFGGIFPSSPLTETEVKIDDQLVSLNEIPVASVFDARNVVAGLDAGNLVKVRIKNNTGEIVRYLYLKRRPVYPVYSTMKNAGRLESLYLHFGFSVDPGFKKKVKQTVKDGKFELEFYKIQNIQESSYLYKMGVKPGDFISILSDFYVQRTRYMEVLHLPADPESHRPEYIEDYIYHLKREEFDENVL